MNYMETNVTGAGRLVIVRAWTIERWIFPKAWVNCERNSRDKEPQAGESISRALIARLIARTRLS
jgi:hypothetical protein